MWRALVRFVIGAAIAIPLWWLTLSLQTAFLASAGAPVVHLDARFKSATLDPSGGTITIRSPQRAFSASTIPVEQITYPLVLLLALFASARFPFRDRNVIAFVKSLLVTATIAVIALVLWIESCYGFRSGVWSAAHYSRGAGLAWASLQTMMQIVGGPAIVFGCWWLWSPGLRGAEYS